MKRRVVRFTKYTFLILAFLAVSGFVYLENSISIYVSEERFENIVTHMEKSEKLPDHFYEVINKNRNGYMERGVWSAFLNTRLLGNKKNCSCSEIYVHPGFVDRYNFPSTYIVQLELEERLGPKKCYNYLMHEFRKSLSVNSLNDLSQNQFSKNLDQLTDREILTLDLFRQNQSNYYKYQQDSTFLDQELNSLMSVSN